MEHPDCLEAVIKILHETYQCRMYSRELLKMGREDARNMHTVRLFTEGDDTRGCGDTIFPPEDEQRAARNMLRVVV